MICSTCTNLVPRRASTAQIRGLPPMLIITADAEKLVKFLTTATPGSHIEITCCPEGNSNGYQNRCVHSRQFRQLSVMGQLGYTLQGARLQMYRSTSSAAPMRSAWFPNRDLCRAAGLASKGG
jgi:hypothetical protein